MTYNFSSWNKDVDDGKGHSSVACTLFNYSIRSITWLYFVATQTARLEESKLKQMCPEFFFFNMWEPSQGRAFWTHP